MSELKFPRYDEVTVEGYEGNLRERFPLGSQWTIRHAPDYGVVQVVGHDREWVICRRLDDDPFDSEGGLITYYDGFAPRRLESINPERVTD